MPRHRFADFLGKAMRVIIPLAISVLLVVWLLHKVHLDQIRSILDHDCRIVFILLMMFITMLSHIIRGIRWGIQLRAVGVPRMSVTAESVSIFGAYAMNLVIPYMGEAWRCIFISRREKVKLSTVVGTDLGDRGSDAVVVLLLLSLALCVAHGTLMQFFNKYPIGRDITHLFSHWELWIAVLFVLCMFVTSTIVFRDKPFFKGVITSCSRIWHGFVVLFHMKGRWSYVFLTLGIWTCYFMETYCCFWAFSFTRQLAETPGMAWGFLPGLIVFVFGSFSMAVPSNGGLGPWNIAVMYALMLFGIRQADAVAYSIIAWSFQSLMLVILGIFSAFYIIITDRKLKAGRNKATPKPV